jgi:hypothetical protein
MDHKRADIMNRFGGSIQFGSNATDKHVLDSIHKSLRRLAAANMQSRARSTAFNRSRLLMRDSTETNYPSRADKESSGTTERSPLGSVMVYRSGSERPFGRFTFLCGPIFADSPDRWSVTGLRDRIAPRLEAAVRDYVLFLLLHRSDGPWPHEGPLSGSMRADYRGKGQHRGGCTFAGVIQPWRNTEVPNVVRQLTAWDGISRRAEIHVSR